MKTTDKRRSRKRLKRQAQRCLAICILFVIEVGGAALAGGLAALVLMPIAYAERGYLAFGGEMMAVFAVTVIAYFIIHNRIFKELQEPQKGGGKHECRNRPESSCGEIRGRNNPRMRMVGSTGKRSPKARVDYIA